MIFKPSLYLITNIVINLGFSCACRHDPTEPAEQRVRGPGQRRRRRLETVGRGPGPKYPVPRDAGGGRRGLGGSDVTQTGRLVSQAGRKGQLLVEDKMIHAKHGGDRWGTTRPTARDSSPPPSTPNHFGWKMCFFLNITPLVELLLVPVHFLPTPPTNYIRKCVTVYLCVRVYVCTRIYYPKRFLFSLKKKN